MSTVFLTGCIAIKPIVVPVGEPVMLLEPVKAKVLVLDGEGNWVRSDIKTVIPAGWVCWYDDRQAAASESASDSR